MNTASSLGMTKSQIYFLECVHSFQTKGFAGAGSGRVLRKRVGDSLVESHHLRVIWAYQADADGDVRWNARALPTYTLTGKGFAYLCHLDIDIELVEIYEAPKRPPSDLKKAYSEIELNDLAVSDLPLLQEICDSDKVSMATHVFAIEALGYAENFSDVEAQVIRYFKDDEPIFRESAVAAIDIGGEERLLQVIENLRIAGDPALEALKSYGS